MWGWSDSRDGRDGRDDVFSSVLLGLHYLLKIDVIAQNSEKFITFACKNLCFKDSFSFLSSSLDKLVKLSKYEDGEKKQNWQNNFKFSKRNPYVSNDEDLDLLTDKGVYP